MKKSLYKQKNVIDIFLKVTMGSTILALVGAVVFFIIALASLANGDSSFTWLLEVFSDFSEIMNVSIEESPYIIEGASYPPLAIMILYPFALICKGVFAKYAGLPLTVIELNTKLLAAPEFWISISLFVIICTVCTLLLIFKKYEFKRSKFLKIALIVVTSAPFFYIVIRGNVTYFALIFTMLFMLLKDSKNPYLRELSYISLAVAGSLKFYPLFFGVFLLKDKKIFASMRVALYFAVIFFSSFFFFEKDLSNLLEFTGNLGGFMSNETRLIRFNNLSISALVFKVFRIFVPTLAPTSNLFSIPNAIILVVVFLVSTIAAIKTKNNLTRLSICAFIVILIPSISYFYVMVFTVFPFLEYINECESLPKKKSKLYFFSFIFFYIVLLALPRFFLFHTILLIFLLVYEVIGVFKNEIFNKKLSA